MKPVILFALLLALRCGAQDPILPDQKLTPGDTLSNVPIQKLCQRGYANVICGGVRHVTESEKRQVFIEYFGKVPEHPGNYEVDHLISIEIGGSNDIKNLWPQSYLTKPWNSNVKDRLEDFMAAGVRHAFKKSGPAAAEALLHQYQHEIASNWTNAFLKYIGPPPSK